MKPSDIYRLTPISTTHDLYPLLNGWHCHIPGVCIDDLKQTETDRIELRTYYDPYIDGERCCTVGAAWFDGQPVMLFRHGGRSGHDEYDEIVTDPIAYDLMVRHLESLRTPVRNPDTLTVDPDAELPDLDMFYNHSLTIVDGKLI